ncbi:uncharacterized protein N7459_006814 [Penicillium hispanicum]|uniref:uncharacterized protein n=1 Tax=Penicillium hispanicum TaxID=1080232 RepID=UPI0025413BA4|nr:uncharacterized protein N7459_006814 [Penicillium hispanicum]KAJ5577850.1 hypothetical protein N7459_006814 [Penicillium hispanicum]
MVELINPPEPRSLLPPLLACLPTAFVSPRPPPALLPLLSPILRQRIQILTSVSTSPTESWLQLLCWDATQAERLQSIVDDASFEPHPVSGEIDLPGEILVTYKRVDDETLRAQVLLPEYSLTVIYLWCPTDEEGGGRGWRVAEVLPREGPAEDENTWAVSIGEANAQAKGSFSGDVLDAKDREERGSRNDGEQAKPEDEDDEDDYWAQYDATPGRTPGVKTPAPAGSSSKTGPSGLSEASYFSQYGEVQPAMDNHDPTEEQPEVGPTSLNGDMLASLLRRQVSGSHGAEESRTNGYAPADMPDDNAARALSHPRPESASSNNSDAVAKLEQEAASQSTYEVGVKQHIGTSIKSLFRLAKATGISRTEFRSMVQTELDLLKLTDHDD